MRNTIIFNTLIILTCLFSTDLMAQLGKTTLSLAGGDFFKKSITNKTEANNSFGRTPSSQTTTTTTFDPRIVLTLERRLSKSFSIGGAFHYVTAQSTSISTNTFGAGVTSISQQNSQAKIGGLSLNPKLFFYSDADFDIYAGAALGFMIASTTQTVSNVVGGVNQAIFSGSNGSEFRILSEINIGGRCFFTENIGIYGEVGFLSLYLGKAAAGQAGIIYRF
jgi:hypothetical protein